MLDNWRENNQRKTFAIQLELEKTEIQQRRVGKKKIPTIQLNTYNTLRKHRAMKTSQIELLAFDDVKNINISYSLSINN